MIETLLNFDPLVLLAFIGAGLLLNITPGVDFLFVTASGINGGPKIGRAAAYGINLGILVHIVLAALGVSALLLAYPAALTAIKWLGAGYLLYIAFIAWNDDGKLGEGTAAANVSSAIKRGFLTNVLNPKTGLFIFAFIPQFTAPEIGPIWQQITILGLIFMLNGFLFSLILGTLAGHLAPLLKSKIRILNKLTAILFGGLAARLVLN